MITRAAQFRMRTRTIVMWAVTISIFVAVIITGCAREQATVVVKRRDITDYLTLQGETVVPAAARAEIVSPYEAPVDKIYVTVGQAVQKGDVVMELAAPQTEVRYQQARQEVRQARQELDQARSRYQGALNRARRELEQAREAEKRARQQAEEQEQQEETNGARVTVTEQPNPELAQAIQRRKQAEQDVLDARAVMEEGLVAYERRLAAAQQELEQAQGGLKVASIRSPISGTVLDINAEIGETARPDQKQPLAVVVDLNAVKVYAGVERENLTRIEHDDSAIVTVKPFPNTDFSGEVDQIYSEKAGLISGEKYVAVIDFQNSQGRAKPGMDATARVEVDEAEDVLAVPASAVYRVNGRPAVRIREANEWRVRVVDTGISDGEYTEIESGLEEGDIVLVNP